MWLKFGIILLINSLVRSEDNLVQISLKKVNNIIDDRFISYTLDSTFLQKQISISEQSLKLTKTLSPAYIKFHEKTLLDFIIENATSSNSIFESKRNNWESLVNWFRNNDLIPVIVLDYHSQTWEPKNVLSYFKLVDKWNLNECVWQLGGDDFNNTNIRKYVNDIKILKTMINTFANRKHSWKIVASKTNSANDNFDEMKLFYDLVPSTVAAISWFQNNLYSNILNSENNLLERDSLVRFFSRASIPTWLTLKPSKSVEPKSICDQACILDGLTWAINLGENSKHGFDVIFKPISEQSHISTNLEYYITKLYKNMIGRKVFDVKLLSGDRGVNFYSYCTKNMSGSITMLAINTADEQMKITTKIGFRSAGNEIMQYILTISDGNILLNNEKLTQDTLIDPFIKYKRLRRPLVLSLPPYSVGFFIFPKADIFECMEADYEDIDIEDKLSDASHKPNNILSKIKASTTDRLLEQLIKENLKKDIGSGKSEVLKARAKRSLSPNKTNLKKNQKITKRQMNRLKRYIVGKKLQLFPYKLSKNSFARKFKKPLLKTLTRKRRQLESKRPEMFPKLKMLTKTGLNKNIRSPITFPPKPGTIMNHPKLNEDEGPGIIFKHSENLNLPDRDVFFKIKDKGESSDSEQEIQTDNDERLEDKNARTLIPAVGGITSLDTELEELKHYARHELPEEIIQFLLSRKNKERKPDESDAIDNNDSVQELNIYGSLMDEINMNTDENTANEDTNLNNDDEQQMESQYQFYVLKELEPTAKQNLENLLKARINLKTFYIDQSKNDSKEFVREDVIPVLAEEEEEEDDINDDGFFSMEDDAEEKKEANKISGQTPYPKNNGSSINSDFDSVYMDEELQIANTTAESSSADNSHNQLIEGLYQLIDILATDKTNLRKELAQDKILIKRAATYKNEDKQKKKIQNNMKTIFMYDTSLEDNDSVVTNLYVKEHLSNHIVRKNPSKTILGSTTREKEENKSSDELTKVLDKTEDDEIISDVSEISTELDNVSNLSTADGSTQSNPLQEEEDVDKELVQNVIKLLSRSFDKCIISLHDTVSSWFNYFQT